ncbi:MAG: alkyl sulfatase dimerization domain-containing protein [Acidimicrobiales bacterium]
MPNVLELADSLWRGEISTGDHHPVTQSGTLVEVADGVAFVPSFANVSAIATDDGLFLVDTGSSFAAPGVHAQLREWNSSRLDTAVFSHGHIDHVFGVKLFEEEAVGRGWRAPRVVAHEALPARFDRYVLTAGYNGVINARQFGLANMAWPTEYRYPDQTYSEGLSLEVGGQTFELNHCRGETDDHTWTWVPDKKLLCCGDLFIWASPNAGNPQKVQRYPREWAAGLRRMVELQPEIMLPGHGLPVLGADRVRQALSETAELLEYLVDETLVMMNAGARLDEILHSVKAPARLLERPYLRPVYDDPEFIIHNIWRLYGGWYDGNPARLKPAPDSAVAHEVANLAGGATKLADRALALAEEGDLRLAGHLAEMAALASPDDSGVQRARALVFGRRAERETSTMAKGVFGWARTESERLSDPSGSSRTDQRASG